MKKIWGQIKRVILQKIYVKNYDSKSCWGERGLMVSWKQEQYHLWTVLNVERGIFANYNNVKWRTNRLTLMYAAYNIEPTTKLG